MLNPGHWCWEEESALTVLLSLGLQELLPDSSCYEKQQPRGEVRDRVCGLLLTSNGAGMAGQ